MELIFDDVMFGELKDENYQLRHKRTFVKTADESLSFFFLVGRLFDSFSGDQRAFMKETGD